MESVIIFGTGGLLKSLYNYIIDIYYINFFLDNNESKHGTKIENKLIIKPASTLLTTNERIIIVSYFFDEIKEQLVNLGVGCDRIFNVADDGVLFDCICSKVKESDNTVRVKNEINAAPVHSNKLNILFVVNSMVMGGSELSLLNLFKKINNEKTNIILLVINGGGALTKRVPNEVTIVEIYKSSDECALQQSIFRYLSPDVLNTTYVNRCFDAVISYTMGSSAKLACGVSAGKKIAWIHSDLSVSHPTKACFGSMENEVSCYNKFSNIVFVSKASLHGFKKLFKGVCVKKQVFGNIFDVEEIINKSKLFELQLDDTFNNMLGKRFLYVGRLSAEKGVVRLINAFDRALKISNDISLVIVGSGELSEKILNLISEKKMESNVKLVGECDNPYPYMRWADVMVLPSYYEGQPLVIGEAFSLGLPIIATNSDACKEMLNDGEFGLVVENSEDGIFNGLYQAMSQQDFKCLYTRKSKAGLTSINTCFDIIKLSFLS